MTPRFVDVIVVARCFASNRSTRAFWIRNGTLQALFIGQLSDVSGRQIFGADAAEFGAG